MTETASTEAMFRPLDFPADYTLDVPLANGTTQAVPIPKSRRGNLEYREKLIAKCLDDEDMAETVRGMCAGHHVNNFLFWLNTFGWTYVPMKYAAAGKLTSVTGKATHVPFITWPVQDAEAPVLFDAIVEGYDLSVRKSRFMGASWKILAMFHWMWQFWPDVNFFEMSRKQDLVDNGDDPDSLFWKHDYLLKMQPAFLVPKHTRSNMKLINNELGSTIIGSATVEEAGHGGRKTACLLDEAGRMRGLQGIWEGLASTTSCRIANSTPHGPNFFRTLATATNVRRVVLPWWDHPDAGRGRHIVTEPATGKLKVRSPAYDAAEARAVSKREMAENWDMDFTGSGFTFFDIDQIDRHRSRAEARPHLYQGELQIDRECDLEMRLRMGSPTFDPLGTVEWEDDEKGHLKLWCELEEDDEGRWRPAQLRTYACGIDISHGQGGSNSVIDIFNVETKEQVAEFASAQVSPDDFADLAVALGYWFGGARGCVFMEWEANGPGGIFGKRVVRNLRYPWKYYQRPEGKRNQAPTDRFGWTSSDVTKPIMLGALRGGMARDEIIVYSLDALNELEQYVYYETRGNGSVGPAQLEEESAAALATHGDRGIATGLAHDAMGQCFRCEPPERVAVRGTAAWRRENKRRQRL